MIFRSDEPCLLCKKAAGYYDDAGADMMRQCVLCHEVIVHNAPGIAPPAKRLAHLNRAERRAVYSAMAAHSTRAGVAPSIFALRIIGGVLASAAVQLGIVGGAAWWATHPRLGGAAPLLLALCVYVARFMAGLRRRGMTIDEFAQQDPSQKRMLESVTARVESSSSTMKALLAVGALTALSGGVVVLFWLLLASLMDAVGP